MEIAVPIIASIAGLAVGAGGIFAYNKKNENGGKDKAEDLVRKAKREASDIVLAAKKEATAQSLTAPLRRNTTVRKSCRAGLPK